MVMMIRDRVQDLIDKGMTLAQVKAARPTMDFDGRYGSTTGPWTTDMFVEAVTKLPKCSIRGRLQAEDRRGSAQAASVSLLIVERRLEMK